MTQIWPMKGGGGLTVTIVNVGKYRTVHGPLVWFNALTICLGDYIYFNNIWTAFFPCLFIFKFMVSSKKGYKNYNCDNKTNYGARYFQTAEDRIRKINHFFFLKSKPKNFQFILTKYFSKNFRDFFFKFFQNFFKIFF